MFVFNTRCNTIDCVIKSVAEFYSTPRTHVNPSDYCMIHYYKIHIVETLVNQSCFTTDYVVINY